MLSWSSLRGRLRLLGKRWLDPSTTTTTTTTTTSTSLTTTSMCGGHNTFQLVTLLVLRSRAASAPFGLRLPKGLSKTEQRCLLLLRVHRHPSLREVHDLSSRPASLCRCGSPATWHHLVNCIMARQRAHCSLPLSSSNEGSRALLIYNLVCVFATCMILTSWSAVVTTVHMS